MKKAKTHSGDANLAIKVGECFFTIAGKFFKTIPEDPAEKQKFLIANKGMLIASTANLAFSIELLLKSVAIKTKGVAKHGHQLIDLFDDLPSVVKTSIEDCYRFRLAHNAKVRGESIELCAYPGTKKPTQGEKKERRLNPDAGHDVRSLLEAESDCFQNWRYFYTQAKASGPVSLIVHWARLGILVNSIQDQFRRPEKRPNYRRPPEQNAGEPDQKRPD